MLPGMETYHDPECYGAPSCDGCGYITWRMYWKAGPTPWWARRFQRGRSELGIRFAIR